MQMIVICLREYICVILLSFHLLIEENPAEVELQMLKTPSANYK